MKLALLGALLAIGSVQATTITASGGTTGAQFVTSAGTFLTPSNATVTVGSLSEGVFTPFAVADASPISFGTTAALEGRWLGNAADTSNAANPFNGLQIWFRIETTADGGGLAFFGSTLNFPANGAGVGDSLSVPGSSLTTFHAGLSEELTASYNAGTNTVVIGVVPEPSALLLGGLGLIGLLRRRR
jgi:hypothetical protein